MVIDSILVADKNLLAVVCVWAVLQGVLQSPFVAGFCPSPFVLKGNADRTEYLRIQSCFHILDIVEHHWLRAQFVA